MKTKFVNINRLRAYNDTIAEWNKYKNKNKKTTENADMQQEKKGSDNLANAHATAPRWAEFDVDNEVTLLNPEVDPVPMPCPDIRVEEENWKHQLLLKVLTRPSPNHEANFDSESNIDPSIPSTSRRESLLETATGDPLLVRFLLVRISNYYGLLKLKNSTKFIFRI